VLAELVMGGKKATEKEKEKINSEKQ